MKRIISQIGDSTDGENQEEFEKTLRKDNGLYVTTLSKYKDPFYSTSYMFKDLGNRLLQAPEVRAIYKGIKQSFIPSEKLTELESLDILLGRGWGTIIIGYNNEKNRKEDKISADQLATYYELNKNMINDACLEEQGYKKLQFNSQKANYYLKEKVKIKDCFKQIYKLNKEIEHHSQAQRQVLEFIPSTLIAQDNDACLFLAKIKASKKLDRDLGKNYLYDYKYGTGKTISDISTARKTTQKDETLEIHTAGAFKHYATDEATYSGIGARLKEYIDNGFIEKDKFKPFFQSLIKGKINVDIVLDEELTTDLLNQLQTLVKFIFGIEVKRNPAALLTNAMFFDLVNAGVYKIDEIDEKMPMAMEGGVSASVTIDKKVDEYLTSISEYDYRGTEAKSKSDILAKKETAILKDWLLNKLGIKIYDTIKTLKQHSAIEDFEKLGFVTDIVNKEENINNNLVSFEHNGNKFNLKLVWNNPLKGTPKFSIALCEVQEINAEVLYELIHEWYGIEIPYLKGIIRLKAAGDKKDKFDPDISHSKILIEEPEIDNTKPLAQGLGKIYEEDSSQDLAIEPTITKKLVTEKGIFDISKGTNQDLFDSDQKRESKKYDKMLQKKREKEPSVEEAIYNVIVEHKSKISNPNELYNIFAAQQKYKDIATQIKKIPGYYDDHEMCARIIKRYAEECNHSLKGSGKYVEEKNIDYINSYFGKYTIDALDNSLHLRISDLQLKNIDIIQGVFIDQKHNNISNLLSQVLNSSESKILVPFNLFNKHAVGLIFEKGKDNIIQVKYLDSMNKGMPQELKQLVFNIEPQLQIEQITVEQQKYANCGVEVIENFILYITGKRLSQEKAIELHSKLVEKALLNINSSELHLLFEESDNSYYSLTDYLEQIEHDNNLSHNIDYDNLQHVEVAGDVTSFH
jgi:hypothetical protein